MLYPNVKVSGSFLNLGFGVCLSKESQPQNTEFNMQIIVASLNGLIYRFKDNIFYFLKMAYYKFYD